jgi:hypothetical protein
MEGLLWWEGSGLTCVTSLCIVWPNVSIHVSDSTQKVIEYCMIWVFHGSDYEECYLLDKNPVHTSQETHYISAAKPSRLMLCMIWVFHGSDYEECRLLGYKNPVHASQETHSIPATEPSRLILCKILCFHGCDYEECHLLGCYAVWLL